MTQPPSGGDRPQDTPRSFPSYTESGRPRLQDTPAPFVPPYSPPQQPPGQPFHQPPFQQQPSHQQPFPQQLDPRYPPVHGQPPYGYGYGFPGVPSRATNGLAVAAMATGLASVLFTIAAPVAVGLGIAALVQIKRRNETGTAQAVVGLVVGGLVTLVAGGLVVAMIVFGLTDDDSYSAGIPQPSSSATGASDPDGIYIDGLVVGECFDDTGVEDEVKRQPCNGPHDGELYAVVTLPDHAWPGDRRMGDQAEAACDERFEQYVGISADESELEPVSWFPDAAGWRGGDHDVYCTTYGPDEDRLDRTVKDSKR
ncbi:hypothetical protein Kfla_0590 [Kribbella flavida DSM 17836]|uniref:Septum formation-related domain-containing protein n=1 Tax=Kribbella flavida (strain DSM 17836 / JCM 10339 / NBRC 14399) TaxID=479435 RepID=D2PX63_KRIFD|nr:DUF4190 domain-containing protein [Kribbella flavida]ADB29711.1 hypothetical protein Kfla_0590 [Kribbella flavida DSM 17836]